MSNSNPERELLRAAIARTPECLDIEALVDAAPGSPAAVHAASCERCRAELALFHQFENAQPNPDEVEALRYVETEVTRRRAVETAPATTPADTSRPPAWRGWRILAWVGACAAVAIGISVYQRPGDTGAVTDGQPVYRSTRITGLAPTGDLPAAPTELRWEPAPSAAGYRIRLLEVDGREIWNAATTENHLAISPGIAPQLRPGRAFQWDVIALDPAGRRIGASDLQIFHILNTQR